VSLSNDSKLGSESKKLPVVFHSVGKQQIFRSRRSRVWIVNIGGLSHDLFLALLYLRIGRIDSTVSWVLGIDYCILDVQTWYLRHKFDMSTISPAEPKALSLRLRLGRSTYFWLSRHRLIVPTGKTNVTATGDCFINK